MGCSHSRCSNSLILLARWAGPRLHIWGLVKSLLFALSVAVGGGAVAVHAWPTTEAQAARAVRTDGPIISISLATADGADIPMLAMRSALISQRGDTVDATKLAADRTALLEQLTSRGYLSAAVAPADITHVHGGAYITYDIHLGMRYRIRTVSVTGAMDNDAVITIGSGDDAIAARIESARAMLADNLQRHGKPHEVSVTTTIDHANLVVDVALAAH